MAKWLACPHLMWQVLGSCPDRDIPKKPKKMVQTAFLLGTHALR